MSRAGLRSALIAVPVVLGAAAVVFLAYGGSEKTVAVKFDNGKAFPVLDGAEIPARGESPGGIEQATFGSGCYWCSEAVFQQLKGVQQVVSGFSGGHVKNPTYEQVCSGTTGHAEVIHLTFDPKVVSYPELLEVFWRMHDPTTKNRQGPDAGAQYRSVIFHHSEQQKQLAELYRSRIDAAGVFPAPIVTEIVPFDEFYPAPEKHQNFYANHPQTSYCRVMIGPKLEKFRSVFKGKLKEQ
jgi:peptide-methionine (S)-S-oxide reductase